MTLSFGKYSGQDLRDVPRDYIEWLIDMRKKDLAEYEGELARREMVEQGSLTMVEQIAAAGYRAMALKMHPDKGGSTGEFQALQAANEQMKVILREVKNVAGTTKNPDDSKAPW
jgi:hypothetical protein